MILRKSRKFVVSGLNLCGLHFSIACGEIVIIIDELAHNYSI